MGDENRGQQSQGSEKLHKSGREEAGPCGIHGRWDMGPLFRCWLKHTADKCYLWSLCLFYLIWVKFQPLITHIFKEASMY